MQRMMVLLKSAFRLALRKKLVLFSMIIFPVFSTFLILVNGVGTSDVDKTYIGVYSEDKSIYSETILQAISTNELFSISTIERNENITLEKQFENIANSNSINIFIHIPKDIQSRIIADANDALIIYDTGSDEKVAFLKASIDPVISRLKLYSSLSNNDEKVLRSMLLNADESSTKGETKSIYDTSDSSTKKDTSGKFALVMGFFSWFAIWGSSYVIAMILKEKDSKVLKRIMLTNTSIPQYFSSKLIIGILIGVVQVLLMLVSFKYIVKADYVVQLWELGILLFGFILIAITINLALVSFCSNEAQVSTLSVVIVNVTAMLSGSYWPLEFMPDWMIRISYFMPQRWIMYTIGQISNQYKYALLQYGLVVFGFIAFFSTISFIGFKYRSRFSV